jgi:hypothetical protein
LAPIGTGTISGLAHVTVSTRISVIAERDVVVKDAARFWIACVGRAGIGIIAGQKSLTLATAGHTRIPGRTRVVIVAIAAHKRPGGRCSRIAFQARVQRILRLSSVANLVDQARCLLDGIGTFPLAIAHVQRTTVVVVAGVGCSYAGAANAAVGKTTFVAIIAISAVHRTPLIRFRVTARLADIGRIDVAVFTADPGDQADSGSKRVAATAGAGACIYRARYVVAAIVSLALALAVGTLVRLGASFSIVA